MAQVLLSRLKQAHIQQKVSMSATRSDVVQKMLHPLIRSKKWIGDFRHVLCLYDQLVGHQVAHQAIDVNPVLDGGKALVENSSVDVDLPTFLPQLLEVSHCSAKMTQIIQARDISPLHEKVI